MELRRRFWKFIWMCSFCTLGITVIYKDGVVIKLESIWGEGIEPVEPIEPEVGSSELDVGAGEFNVGPNGLKDEVKPILLPLVIIKLTRSVWSAQ